jgi:hypothetical protein
VTCKSSVFLIDEGVAFPYLTGLLNRMTNPAIAAATLLIRCLKNTRLACERLAFALCH